jgi:hypothetical protein
MMGAKFKARRQKRPRAKGYMITLSYIMQLARKFLIFSNFGAVQKEIEGILSPNNIWPSVFCYPGNKKLVADYQL